MQTPCLSVHLLDDNIVDLTKKNTVFQHLPGLIRVKMNFYQTLVTDSQKAVTIKIIPYTSTVHNVRMHHFYLQFIHKKNAVGKNEFI